MKIPPDWDMAHRHAKSNRGAKSSAITTPPRWRRKAPMRCHLLVSSAWFGSPSPNKMEYTLENITYEIIIASDMRRDGIGVELHIKGDNKFLVEIFRNDAKKKIEFYAVEVDVPFKIIEKVLEVFEANVGREFQD